MFMGRWELFSLCSLCSGFSAGSDTTDLGPVGMAAGGVCSRPRESGPRKLTMRCNKFPSPASLTWGTWLQLSGKKYMAPSEQM